MTKTRLGVNIDHVATVRNARGEIYPSPLRAAILAEKCGAHSVTIHLREDRRHINDLDLKEIKAKKLLISVPLKLWFSSAYRSSTDLRDRHYHEFESWQLDWLLEKTGWTIIASDKWTNPTKKIGIRTLFRFFVPRYYIVYAEKRD